MFEKLTPSPDLSSSLRVTENKKTLLDHAEDGARMLKGYETITQELTELKISHK